MTRIKRFLPGEVDHISYIDGVTMCSCGEKYKKRRRRFARHFWMREHVKCGLPDDLDKLVSDNVKKDPDFLSIYEAALRRKMDETGEAS